MKIAKFFNHTFYGFNNGGTFNGFNSSWPYTKNAKIRNEMLSNPLVNVTYLPESHPIRGTNPVDLFARIKWAVVELAQKK